MAKQYSEKHIIDALSYWHNALKMIDESQNALLDELFTAFSADDLLKVNSIEINDNLLNKCFNILNSHIFSSMLPKIPLKYEYDAAIRDFLISRKSNPRKIPKTFFGVHSVICDNDKIMHWTDELMLHDDVILLNKNHINGKSLTFFIACLCHEMIHFYDRLFGEYCSFTKYAMMTGIEKNKHNTATFEKMREYANDLGINVIQDIPVSKDAEILDKEAIELMLKKAEEDGLILEEDSIGKDTESISYFCDRSGCVINTF